MIPENEVKWRKRKTPRDKKYLEFVRSHHCIDCYYPRNKGYIEAHHVKTGGMGIKCSDYDTVPLCSAYARGCHAKADKRKETPERYLDAIVRLQQEWISKGGKIEDTEDKSPR